MNYFLRRFVKFETQFEHISIQDYFRLATTSVQYRRVDNHLFLTVIDTRPAPLYDIHELPIEISRLIAEYLSRRIEITLKISFTPSYPFDEPKWELLDVLHNFTPPIDLKEYYKYIVQNHNRQSLYWSPATSIEKDILEFIQKINHFEYLENLNVGPHK